MTEMPESHPLGLNTSRIITFSDGVFAIVITLLVIDLKVPQIIAGDISAELPGRLFDLWPKLLSYTLSFVIIGVYWVAHHHVFHYIVRVDRISLWLNIFFLMSVAFVPFPTALLGEYSNNRLAVIIYGVNVMATRLLLLALWLYSIYRHRLINPEMQPATLNRVTWLILIPVGIYLFAIGLSFLSTRISLALYFLVPLVFSVIPSRLNRGASL